MALAKASGAGLARLLLKVAQTVLVAVLAATLVAVCRIALKDRQFVLRPVKRLPHVRIARRAYSPAVKPYVQATASRGVCRWLGTCKK
jgi:hypothetical protein